MTTPDARPRAGWSRPPVSWVLATVLVVAGVLAVTWRSWPAALPAVPTDLDRLAPDVARARSPATASRGAS